MRLPATPPLPPLPGILLTAELLCLTGAVSGPSLGHRPGSFNPSVQPLTLLPPSTAIWRHFSGHLAMVSGPPRQSSGLCQVDPEGARAGVQAEASSTYGPGGPAGMRSEFSTSVKADSALLGRVPLRGWGALGPGLPWLPACWVDSDVRASIWRALLQGMVTLDLKAPSLLLCLHPHFLSAPHGPGGLRQPPPSSSWRPTVLLLHVQTPQSVFQR